MGRSRKANGMFHGQRPKGGGMTVYPLFVSLVLPPHAEPALVAKARGSASMELRDSPASAPSAPGSGTEDEARREDARIVEAIAAGKRVAEEELYRRHAGSVLRLATRLLRSTEDARDVLQDTFLAAFSDLGALREPGSVKPWLHTICVRLVHRRFRRRKLLRMLGLDRTEEDAKLAQLASPDIGPDGRADLRALDRALDALPSDERVAWVLRHVEGLALGEVAASCGCSLATAKRRIAAAAATVDRLRGGCP